MNNVSEIRAQYPTAYKAKPKGWKFVVGQTIVRNGDMIWRGGTGPYGVVNTDNFSGIGASARVYVPIIRQIKTSIQPKITPLPEFLKASLPKGYVYLGKGGEFKVPKDSKEYNCDFNYSNDSSYDGRPLKWAVNWTRAMVSCKACYYIFPINSEIARLNGVKPNANLLLEENAALRKELEELKRKIKALAE